MTTFLLINEQVFAGDTVSVDQDASSNTLTPTNPSAWPHVVAGSDIVIPIAIEDEIQWIEDSTTSPFQVLRHQERTLPATHAAGKSITIRITAAVVSEGTALTPASSATLGGVKLRTDPLSGDPLAVTAADTDLPTSVFGAGHTQAVRGDDAALTNARTPTGSASGDLGGSYPGPTVAHLTNVTDGSLGTTGMADASVTTAKLVDANVTTGKMADGSVTTAKITDANVTTGKIADATITTAKIVDANVTTGKLANNSVTAAKLSSGAAAAGTVATADGAGNVTYEPDAGGGGGSLPSWMASFTPPVALTSWTWRNQGTATASDESDGLYLAIPMLTAIGIRGLTRPLGAPPYTITAAFLWSDGWGGNLETGIFIHDSVGGKSETLAIWRQDQQLGFRWSDLSTPDTSLVSLSARNYDVMWLQIKDDGTTLIFSLSPDGNHWSSLPIELSGSYFTPNCAGIFVDGQGDTGAPWMKLLSWAIT